MEDVDLCLRVRAEGLRVVYEPAARIVHHESKSEGRFHHASANIQRFRAAHGSQLVPDLHVWDRSCSWPSSWTLSTADVPGSDNVALRGWSERRELVAQVGGFDLTLPPAARVADWLDRVRLLGGIVLEEGGVDSWACRGREHSLAGGSAALERSLVRRWGTCDPSHRTPVQLLPLSDTPQDLDAEVVLDAREYSYLLTTDDAQQLERVATQFFEDFAAEQPELRSLVVRIAPGKDTAYDSLERAADAASGELTDIVVIEAGPEVELRLAAACMAVLIFGDDEQELALTSLALAAGSLRHHPGVDVSAPRSG